VLILGAAEFPMLVWSVFSDGGQNKHSFQEEFTADENLLREENVLLTGESLP
jgi:hypothetical protein